MKQNFSKDLEAERKPQTDGRTGGYTNGETWPPYTAFFSLLLLFRKECLQLILAFCSYYEHTVCIPKFKMI
jgi:hypothetical protein